MLPRVAFVAGRSFASSPFSSKNKKAAGSEDPPAFYFGAGEGTRTLGLDLGKVAL